MEKTSSDIDGTAYAELAPADDVLGYVLCCSLGDVDVEAEAPSITGRSAKRKSPNTKEAFRLIIGPLWVLPQLTDIITSNRLQYVDQLPQVFTV
jgi:hypothetical protein